MKIKVTAEVPDGSMCNPLLNKCKYLHLELYRVKTYGYCNLFSLPVHKRNNRMSDQGVLKCRECLNAEVVEDAN